MDQRKKEWIAWGAVSVVLTLIAIFLGVSYPAPPQPAGPVEAPSRNTVMPPRRTEVRSRRSAMRPAPTVWRIRPQLASPPKTAVLTSSEFAMRRAARSAWTALRAPLTRTSISLVAPSPSRARSRARAVATSLTAARKRRSSYRSCSCLAEL